MDTKSKMKPNAVTSPPWAPSDDPELAEKNNYLGPIPSQFSED
jgi:hypothetical protein